MTVAAQQEALTKRYLKTRAFTEAICEPLEAEDTVVQSMEDVSPPKWHLGHTSWFFETFLLQPYLHDYQEFHEGFHFIFNSYYEGAGERILRVNRGILSRPTFREVLNYRHYVDEAICKLIESGHDTPEILFKIELGLNHEQQHQELLYTDIKHILFSNPLNPAYREYDDSFQPETQSRKSVDKGKTERIREKEADYENFGAGLVLIGHNKKGEFAYDNESPSHRHYLDDFRLRKSCVSNYEYSEFIEDGGYQKAELWLSDGWELVQKEKWLSPLYWKEVDSKRFEYTLFGWREWNPENPVCHISFFEADAFARWRGERLPTEFEWEFAFKKLVEVSNQHNNGQDEDSLGLQRGNFAETGLLHPSSECFCSKTMNMFGNVWEWTSSSYLPYPGFKSLKGVMGEYNGKFMNNQRVLKGGSCVTLSSHIRDSYRNFFEPSKRWQFSGIRLASQASKT